ncbi:MULTISPECIES: phosphatase PAP2 family protein [unclassified Paenibacillus]|uniref:phosphatase PAP2 family protein n=1 Tax=unclassified Paenibacillus TaxID=185978 RepID=UPI00104E9670|nr:MULTISPECIES: phosphatase PAP2 family protein [unclassified Paenibacillus]NIK70548.1 undecaprenyl-diphosphatase [Paenibacillus sp. BK720]TCM91047.1 undecaprenyl-diphosphatase [Paenibacillus sp. BK033]
MDSIKAQNKVLLRSFVFTILILFVFGWIAQLVSGQRIAVFDNNVTDAIRGVRSDAMTVVMRVFTELGSEFMVILIVIAFSSLFAFIGYRRELIFYLGVIVSSALLNLVLKTIFQRARPDINRIIEASGFSFPSGHSMSAFTLYGITIYFLWKHLKYRWMRAAVILVGVVIIAMIGISRIYLGVHYPSDVIGGYLVSAAWLMMSIGLYERFLEQRWLSRKLRRQNYY